MFPGRFFFVGLFLVTLSVRCVFISFEKKKKWFGDTTFRFQQITIATCLWFSLEMTQIPCDLVLLSPLLSVQLSTPSMGTLPALPVSSPSNTMAAGITGASQMKMSLNCPGVPPHRTTTWTKRRDTV